MITVDEIYWRLHVLVLHQIADITNCKKVPLIVYWKSLYNLSQGLLVKQSIRNIIAWRNGGVQLMNSWFYSVLVYGSRYVQRYHLQTNNSYTQADENPEMKSTLVYVLFSLPSTNNYLFQGHKRSLKGKWCHKRCHKRHHRMPKEQINLQ